MGKGVTYMSDRSYHCLKACYSVRMRIDRFIVSGGDNYNYLLIDESSGKAAAIDPLETETLLKRAQRMKAEIVCIINTHSHHDHTGGNQRLSERTGAPVLAYRGSPQTREYVDDGDDIPVGASLLRVLYTPGHTKDSICLLADRALYTGDTVFYAGAGNCYSGDPQRLFESFDEKIMLLPDDTVVYPGHEYAKRNLEFALSLEPGNRDAQKKHTEALADDMNLSTIGEERLYNPFFRYNEPALVRALQAKGYPKTEDTSPKSVFLAVREMRNAW